jgi:tetratricopeptide (TPR) repeat protein
LVVSEGSCTCWSSRLPPDRPPTSCISAILAAVPYRRGDFDDALVEAQGALALSPNLADAHGVLGAILVFSGGPKQGVAALERNINLDPRGLRRVIRLNQIALGLYFFREYEAAVRLAKQVIREHPEYHLYRVAWRSIAVAAVPAIAFGPKKAESMRVR